MSQQKMVCFRHLFLLKQIKTSDTVGLRHIATSTVLDEAFVKKDFTYNNIKMGYL